MVGKGELATQIGAVLMDHGVLTMGQVHEVLCKQHGSEKLFGEVAQDIGLATLSQVNAALADQQHRRKKRNARMQVRD